MPVLGRSVQPTIADFITICIVLPVFYFTYTYFVVSDYLASLCTFIFERYGRNLSLFFGSYTLKLMVALLVISIVPLAAIVVDLFSYTGERLQARDPGRCRLGGDRRGDLRLLHRPLAAAADRHAVARHDPGRRGRSRRCRCRSPPTTRSAS